MFAYAGADHRFPPLRFRIHCSPLAVHTAIAESENAVSEEETLQRIHEKQNLLLAKGAPPATAMRLARNLVHGNIFDEKNKVFKDHLKDGHHLDYKTIVEMAKRGGSDKDVSAAMDSALEKTIDYFEQHSYYMSCNQDLLGKTASNI